MAVKASVKKGFGVAKQSLGIVGLLSLFGFIFNLINSYYAPQLQSGTPSVQASVIVGIATVIFIFLSIYLQAGTLGYVKDVIKQGQATMSSFTGAGGKFYLKIFLTGLAITSIIVVFVAIGAVLAAFLQIVGIVLAVLLGLAGIYVVLLMFFAPYLVVLNELGPIAAIKQSIAFVQKNILPVIGISLILVLIGFLVGLLIGVVVGLVSLANQEILTNVVTALFSSLLNSYLGVVVSASFMSFYLSKTTTQ